MAFLPSIPQPTDQLSVSQGNILNNFTILGAIAGNTNAGSASLNGTVGFNFINLSSQGGTIPTVTSGNNGIFCGNISYGSFQETFLINYLTSTSTNLVVPMTNSIISTGTVSSGPGTRGWSYLPSGILIKWGQVAATAVASFPINVAWNAGGDEPNWIQGPLIPFVTPTNSPTTSTSTPTSPFSSSMPVGTLNNITSQLVISVGLAASGSQGAYWMMIGY